MPTDPTVIQAKRLLLTTWAEVLLTWHHQIRHCDQRLKELFCDHPDREIVRNLHGVGLRLAARMAAVFGEDRMRCASARAVVA